MFKHYVADANGVPLDVHAGLDDHPTRITESLRTLVAHWQSAEITTATTTTIVPAIASESIMLTDFIITLSKKVVSATIIPRFYDGTNTVNLFTFDAGTAGFQFSHTFTGGLKGWKDADFQIVTNAATTVSVLVGYVHISAKATKSYSEWNSER
ncbi:hypothetical protein ACFL3R_00585 [Thermodesulfobacteriota bacterium]